MKLLPLLLAAVVLVGCGTTTDAGLFEPKPEPMAEQNVPVSSLKASYEKTKGALAADKSPANEKRFVDATVAYATAVMVGTGDSKEKYRRALELYDEALEIDPANDEAKTNKQLILDIYKSLDKEPPK